MLNFLGKEVLIKSKVTQKEEECTGRHGRLDCRMQIGPTAEKVLSKGEEKCDTKGRGKAPNGTAAGAKMRQSRNRISMQMLNPLHGFVVSVTLRLLVSKPCFSMVRVKSNRAKARAFHVANKQPEQAEKSTPNAVASPESNQKDELPGNINIEPPKGKNLPTVASMHSSEAENGSGLSSKKRKLEATENDSTRDVSGVVVSGELGNGEVIQVERAEKQKSKHEDKKVKHGVTEEKVEDSSTEEDAKKKLKWKKLIKSALKSNPDGVLKLMKLRKLVLGSLRESGFVEDEGQLADMLEQKINSSSKFTVDGKYVRLVAKS